MKSIVKQVPAAKSEAKAVPIKEMVNAFDKQDIAKVRELSSKVKINALARFHIDSIPVKGTVLDIAKFNFFKAFRDTNIKTEMFYAEVLDILREKGAVSSRHPYFHKSNPLVSDAWNAAGEDF
jgi:hypothetical protein